MATTQTQKIDRINYNDLLNEALTGEGTISKCYSLFHKYSIQNQFLACMQLRMRGLDISPINSFSGWNKLNRNIKKGEKAISLWMPINKKYIDKEDENKEKSYTYFVMKNNWFSLDQTTGEDFKQEDIKINFNFGKVYHDFDIKLVKFDMLDGNVQGYANVAKKELAINPLAQHPEMTILHEVAHIALKHNTVDYDKSIKEVESETVAYIIGSILKVDSEDLKNSRGYIQAWLSNQALPEKNAKNIFTIANKILKSGIIKD